MPKPKPIVPKKMGRPEVEVDEILFEKVIRLPMIKADIASVLCISEDTLDTYIKGKFGITFSVLQDQKRGTFKGNVLGKQYEMAMKGSIPLLIWLGKQYLGQSDKQETKLTGQLNSNITTESPETQLQRVKDMVKDEPK